MSLLCEIATQIAAPTTVFKGFLSSALWLVMGGLLIGTAAERSGFGRWVAKRFLGRFRSSYPMLILGILVGTTTLSFLIPANMGRTAITVPVVMALCREAGYGVGATRWEVVRSHVLPYAAPGIFTGTVLSLARALGEAAPLILVGAVTGRLASDAGMLDLGQLTDRFTAMPIVITEWASQPDSDFRALTSAAIVVLLAVVLVANTGAILLRNHYEKKRVR